MSMSRRAAAFFDIDGTLLPPPSLEMRFASWLFAQDLVSSWQIASWAAVSLATLLTGEAGAFSRGKTYLAGLPAFLVQRWEASLAPGALRPYPQSAERIMWHLGKDHRLFLVSGTLNPLAEVFAKRLSEAVGVRATSLEVVDGYFTGFVEGAHMSGCAKANVVAQLANEHGISLCHSYAYGNHVNDLPMLESVGNPVIVNPGIRLKRIAARRGWPVANWNEFWSSPSASPNALWPEEVH